jgi:hypothetical protein
MSKNRVVRAAANAARQPDMFRFVYQAQKSEIKGEWYTMHPENVYRPNSRYPVTRVEFAVKAELGMKEETE